MIARFMAGAITGAVVSGVSLAALSLVSPLPLHKADANPENVEQPADEVKDSGTVTESPGAHDANSQGETTEKPTETTAQTETSHVPDTTSETFAEQAVDASQGQKDESSETGEITAPQQDEDTEAETTKITPVSVDDRSDTVTGLQGEAVDPPKAPDLNTEQTMLEPPEDLPSSGSDAGVELRSDAEVVDKKQSVTTELSDVVSERTEADATPVVSAPKASIPAAPLSQPSSFVAPTQLQAPAADADQSSGF